jgi:hypothetical protein
MSTKKLQFKGKLTVQLVHPDDVAVFAFAIRCRQKMAKMRRLGREGWDRSERCSTDHLAMLFMDELLRDDGRRPDPVDLANYLMMIWTRKGQRDLAEHAANLLGECD